MTNRRQEDGGPVREADGNDGWAFSHDPNVRKLLDHVAEELAAEFVRLMRASVVPESDTEHDKEKR